MAEIHASLAQHGRLDALLVFFGATFISERTTQQLQDDLSILDGILRDEELMIGGQKLSSYPEAFAESFRKQLRDLRDVISLAISRRG